MYSKYIFKSPKFWFVMYEQNALGVFTIITYRKSRAASLNIIFVRIEL